MKVKSYNMNYAQHRGPRSDFIRKLQGSRVTVAGMARAGLAAAILLNRLGAEVTVSDMKPSSALEQELQQMHELNIRTETGGHKNETFTECDLVVTSPGIPFESPHIKRSLDVGIPVWSEIELAYHYFPGSIIAVTGTNGKTTTVTLTGRCLEEQGQSCIVCGNTGYPLTAAVLDAAPDTVIVAEISSFQLERISFFKPDIAFLLNISPDHMDRYDSFHEYVQFKYRITENQLQTDHLILNSDDRLCLELQQHTQARVWHFSPDTPVRNGAFIVDGLVVFRDEHSGEEIPLFPVSVIRIPGRHNVKNVLATAIAARLSGVSTGSIETAVSGFRGVKHRLELIRELDGVRYYDDTPGTNIEAVRAALETFREPVVLIAGGKAKDSDFTPLAALVRNKVKALVLMGESMTVLKQQLGAGLHTVETESLEEAVHISKELAAPGDVVLLSPLCASFDMFRDYRERGELYRKYVEEL